MTTWLIHAVGESDLGVSTSSHDPDAKTARADLVRRRVAHLRDAVARSDEALLHAALTQGTWDDAPAIRRPALAGALAAFTRLAPDRARDPVRLVLVGTDQSAHRTPDGDDLDMHEAAHAIAAALKRYPSLLPSPVDLAPVAVARPTLSEKAMIEALATCLTIADGDTALVSWGSASTCLALGAASALTRAQVPWQFLSFAGPRPELLSPLPDSDPVAAVAALLLRWRMFGALSQAAASGTVSLTNAQRHWVDEAAKQWERGYRAHSAEDLRALVADAVVRLDGTAGIAVRRYISAWYRQLLLDERDASPTALRDLLHYAEGVPNPDGSPRSLGQQIGLLAARANESPVKEQRELPSTRWLLDEEFRAFNSLGTVSHDFGLPSRDTLNKVANHLRDHDDGHRFEAAGLIRPPVVPGRTVLAVWPVGLRAQDRMRPVGEQLLDHGLGYDVLRHVTGGVSDEKGPAAALHACLLGTPDSLDRARAEAETIKIRGTAGTGVHQSLAAVEATAESVPFHGSLDEGEAAKVLNAAAAAIGDELAAVLVVPTGAKGLAMPTIRAAHTVAAQRGVPLLLRETRGSRRGALDVHLWPTLTHGDRPLLTAAASAVQDLELDVAARLLAVTSQARSLGQRCQALASAFTCRKPGRNNPWPPNTPGATSPDRRILWRDGLVAQRVELVASTLTPEKTLAAKNRLMILAWGVVEASTERSKTGHTPTAKLRDAEWILAVLRRSRNRAAVTHGLHEDPNDVVAEAVHYVLTREGRRPADELLPTCLTDLGTLLDYASYAARLRYPPAPVPRGSDLRALHSCLLSDITQAMHDLERRPAPTPGTR